MAILKTTLGLFTAMTLTSAAASLVGCSSQDLDGPHGSESGPAGTIGLALQAAPGFVLNVVSYTITGPSGFVKTGTIDVSNSTKVSALIGSLPAGKGFSVTLSGDAVGGVGSCTGSASFDIVARQTTPVTVRLTCHEVGRTGSVLINGVLNVCSVIDGVSATPGEVAVGSNIALGVAAHDADAGPKPLKYRWKASSGTLSNDAVANPTFTCTAPGSVTITVSVSDGDPSADCTDTSNLVVECSQSCKAYNSITAALGELTADCRGTVDPRDYVIGTDGRLAPNFDNCPADPNNEAGALLRIKQLLAVQHASDLPDVVKCTAGRFKQAQELFISRGIDQCPKWSNKKVQNPPTAELVKTLSALLPQLAEEQPTRFDAPFVPPPELDGLKVKSTYTVTPATANQQCGTAAECAAACAEAFPGFVIPSVPGTTLPEDTILVDPDSWWTQEFYGAADQDPYNLNTAFYHQMGFVLPAPGETYGALARWNPCNATVVNTDPATGNPYTLPLIATTSTSIASPQITTECQSEKCNYYAGGGVNNPIYVKTKLQRWCADPTGQDQSTCLSYCGPKPPPPPVP